MKFLRFLLVSIIVLLVGCEESVEENPVVTVYAKPVSEASSIIEISEQDLELESSGDQIELVNVCYNDEIYIEEEKTCSLKIDCNDTNSCIEWGNKVITDLEADYGSLVYEESVATGNEGISLLASYNVDHEGEMIYTEEKVSEEMMEYHSRLWYSFSWLIPEQYRKAIDQFEVFESGDTLAYVSLHDKYGRYWTLGMNNKDIELASETLVTYLHEYAHFLSLNGSQIDYWVAKEECTSLFLKDSGCFYEDAYLDAFYKKFWESGGHGKIEDFYVSRYAMYSPEEDFSESFAHFILTKTPSGQNVMEEKLLFFYEYEELVQLRTEILARTATWLVRSAGYKPKI
ncbi:putative zinc-binding metallopeptidase [Ureibacillus sp. GCM10028918]|uniref:putative zinc-binding metallopeptidase n=1 Tax=Ureibacillus sp. GCM10028918 TaxID=3273429 RepID=UPI00361A545A